MIMFMDILLGLILVVAFIVVITYYYSPKRKKEVEAAKYEMLRDDDIEESPTEPKEE